MQLRRLLLPFAFLTLAAAAQAKEVIPFIENDYSKAVALAKSEHRPLFVEAWAPW